MSNTLMRQWCMLKNIPRHPAKIGTKALQTVLEKEGFETSQRTIQRDLKTLSATFPDLQSDENLDAAGWSWLYKSKINDFPAIDPPMALTFKLVERFLTELIPPTMLQFLEPYLVSSGEVLEKLDNPGFAHWADKIAIVPRTQPLLAASIDEEVIATIYSALLNQKQFKGCYQRRNGEKREYNFHPLGIVLRESVVYLVATIWKYKEPYHYALHRFSKTVALTENAVLPENFSLQKYIETGTFEYAIQSNAEIKLTAIFSSSAAFHLRETPLSLDQKITDERDGRVQIIATVKNSQQLRWWLLGFGDQVEVVRPVSLRKEFQRISIKMINSYTNKKCFI